MSSNVTVTEDPGMQWGLYTKAIASLVVTGLTAYITAASDDVVTTVDWISIAIAVLAAAGIIWAIPNTPSWLATYGKSLAAALIAGLSSIIIGIQQGDNGLSQTEIITAIVGFIAALGVVAVAPNAASSDPVNPTTGQVVPITREEKLSMIVHDTAAPTATQLPPEEPTV
jgi:hypothetical protein